MPDRCTDPTCEQHWPVVCGPTWLDDCELPVGHDGNHRKDDVVWTTTSPRMYREATHRHDCKARGCIR